MSLVVVLDADKEGFLRSRSSLIQVAGRAARNVNGKVILYGDKITDSMQFLIDETSRRRKIQSEYNKKNGITPQTILKSIEEIKMSTAVANDENNIKDDVLQISENTIEGVDIKENLELLNKKMLKYAKDLQFEKAAILRDEIKKVEDLIK